MHMGGAVPIKDIRDRPAQVGLGVSRRPVSRALLGSLKHDGQQWPAVLNGNTYEVIDGQRRLDAARRLGWETLRCVVPMTFLTTIDDLAATIEFEDGDGVAWPHDPPLNHEIVDVLSQLRALKHPETRAIVAAATSAAKKGVKAPKFPASLPPGTKFLDEAVRAFRFNGGVINRLNMVVVAREKLPANMQPQVEAAFAGMVAGGSVAAMEKRLRELRDLSAERSVGRGTASLSTEEIHVRMLRILTSLETMAAAGLDLKHEIMRLGDSYTPMGKEFERRKDRTQRRLGQVLTAGALGSHLTREKD